MNFDLYFYWKLLLRRFPVMALLITLCTGLGAYSAMRLPETFTTSARMLVEEAQIPVASPIRTDAVEQLDIIQQRLLTRANLIDIANRFNVYEDLGLVEPDIIVQRMQSDTTVRRSAGRSQATLMTISFNGRSGQIVSNVVNEYVTLVLETNQDFRMSRAENTLEFFEQEAARLDEDLNAQGIRVANFKGENADALPEDQNYRLGRQSLLQERVSLLERDLRTTTTQRGDIARIFEATGRIGQNRTQVRTAEEQQLLVARTDLDLALAIYTEQNPRVIRLRSIVERLEAIVANQNSPPAEGEPQEFTSPEEAMFAASMIEIDNRIALLENDIEQSLEELDLIQRAISASSANGILLDTLERDYQIIQTRYDTAVGNLNQARMSERIEIGDQGQRISIVENANIPRLPSGPNRPRIIALGAGVGIAMAAGFFILLELLNRSFRRPAELISRFNIAPMTTIPYLESRGRKATRRIGLVAGTLVAIVGVPLALWYIDTNYMPLDLLVQKVLTRLGIM